MKTIEQISHEICDKYALTVDLSIPIEDAIKEAQRWIPIEEELPKNMSSVLVRNNDYSPIRSIALFMDNLFYPDFVLSHSQVTHWRPIELK